MTLVAHVDEMLRAAGLPVVSVRSKGGILEPVLAAEATAAQKRKAQKLIDTFELTTQHRVEDAARKRGLTPLQLAVARRELAREYGRTPPAWTAQALADGLADLDHLIT